MSLYVTRALGLHPHGSVPRGTPVDSLGVGRSNHPDLELAIEELHFRVDWAYPLRHVRVVPFEG